MPQIIEQDISTEPMTEQAFLKCLQQSMLESEQHQLALGRAPQRATLGQALAQVKMLRDEQQEWCVSSHPARPGVPD